MLVTDNQGLIVLILVFICYRCNFFFSNNKYCWLQKFNFTDI